MVVVRFGRRFRLRRAYYGKERGRSRNYGKVGQQAGGLHCHRQARNRRYRSRNKRYFKSERLYARHRRKLYAYTHSPACQRDGQTG